MRRARRAIGCVWRLCLRRMLARGWRPYHHPRNRPGFPRNTGALLKWTLGVPLLRPEDVGRPCVKCGQPVDAWGDHVVCCNKNEIQRRHLALQLSLSALLKDAGLSYTLEKGTGDGTRPPDIPVPRWDADAPAAIDVTVRCHCAPSNPTTDPSALPKWKKDQEEEKQRLYADRCLRAKWAFFPFLMDTHAGLGDEDRRFMTLLLPNLQAATLGGRSVK